MSGERKPPDARRLRPPRDPHSGRCRPLGGPRASPHWARAGEGAGSRIRGARAGLCGVPASRGGGPSRVDRLGPGPGKPRLGRDAHLARPPAAAAPSAPALRAPSAGCPGRRVRGARGAGGGAARAPDRAAGAGIGAARPVLPRRSGSALALCAAGESRGSSRAEPAAGDRSRFAGRAPESRDGESGVAPRLGPGARRGSLQLANLQDRAGSSPGAREPRLAVRFQLCPPARRRLLRPPRPPPRSPPARSPAPAPAPRAGRLGPRARPSCRAAGSQSPSRSPSGRCPSPALGSRSCLKPRP